MPPQLLRLPQDRRSQKCQALMPAQTKLSDIYVFSFLHNAKITMDEAQEMAEKFPENGVTLYLQSEETLREFFWPVWK